MNNTIDYELDLSRNLLGKLTPEIKERIRAVYNDPNEKTWNNAYSILVSPCTTLWNAVIAVRPDFCRSKELDDPWPMIPTQEDIRMAMRYATH